MDAFHHRLAHIGLAAAERFGFALAGGYAVQAAGLVKRPSEDIDLFTAWERRSPQPTSRARAEQSRFPFRVSAARRAYQRLRLLAGEPVARARSVLLRAGHLADDLRKRQPYWR